MILTTAKINNDVRTETWQDKEYWVVPVVAVKEGVLNGNYLSAKVIQESEPLWNGKYIPVTHPVDGDGNFLSVNDPDIIENQVVGNFFNVEVDGNKLKGEMWLDKEKMRTLGGEAKKAYERFKDGEMVEVSTAYFPEYESESGTFNGEDYDGIHYDIYPDHLALLPDDIGACSIADGCGAPRVNKELVDNPYPNEHSCRLENPDDFQENSFRRTSRENYSVIFGKLEGEDTMTEQAYRYSTDDWTESEARTHCNEHGGEFHSAGSENMETNIRSTARTPTYTGTTTGEWNAPTLSDLGFDSVEEMTGEEKTDVAEHSLLGEAGADTFNELLVLPVVDANGNLSKNALANAKARANQVSGISSDTVTSVKNRCTQLLEDEFGVETQKKTISQTLADGFHQIIKTLRGEEIVTKEEMVAQLVECEKVSLEQETLEEMSEDELKWLAGLNANEEEETEPETSEEPETNEETEKDEEPETSEEHEQLTIQQLIKESGGPKAVTEVFETAKLQEELIANEDCTLDEEEIEDMELATLKKVQAMLKPEDYSGQGGPRDNSQEDEEYPGPPKVVTAKKGDDE